MSESLIDASLYINSLTDTPKKKFYEKISDNEDIYLIHTENHSYELHRDRLIDALKELHKSSHMKIDQLNEKQAELLASTVETTQILYNTKALKDLVLKDIQRIYSHIKNPLPGTVGAFFIGCFNNDNFNGPLGCNPRCAASLLKCDGVNFECGDTILIFSKHEFTCINKKSTSHAYIYIEDEKFTKFSNHELNQLNQTGVKSVTMIYGNADGTYREITNEIILDHVNGDESSSSVWLILLIFIIILLLIALFYFYGQHLM